MSEQRMRTLAIIDIPLVGTVFERPHGGWNWRHLDGTDTMTGAVPGQNTLEWRGCDANGDPRWFIEPYEPDGQPVDFFTKRAALASLLAYHFGLGFAEAIR